MPTQLRERNIRNSLPEFQIRYEHYQALHVPGANVLATNLTPCPHCDGTGEEKQGNVAYQRSFCRPCNGIGFVDMPLGPTTAMPGTTMKISAMAARYEAGLPLFDARDAR